MQDVSAQSQPNSQAMRPNRVLGSVKSSFANGGFFQTTQASSSQSAANLSVTDVVPASDLSNQEKMDLWSAVMDEVEQSSTEVVLDPLASSVDQNFVLTDQPVLQTPQPAQEIDNTFIQSQMAVQAANQPTTQPVQTARPSSKESLSGTPTLEVGTAAAAIEYEKTNEISPEVESYIQKVEDHVDQLPQEVVIADGSVQLNPVQYAAQPVVVIPITEKIEQEGSKKNATFSIRWLVEWSHKVIKMFSGKAIYKQEK